MEAKMAADAFENLLKSGFYTSERSKNNEVDYVSEKESRDMEGFKKFVKSEYFEIIKGLE